MSALMLDNGNLQKSIKGCINKMKHDIDITKAGPLKDEPEFRCKQMMHKTMTAKFRDVLRTSQSIQTEFKNAVENRMKKQIRLAKKDATEEEVAALARDPEAVQKLMQD